MTTTKNGPVTKLRVYYKSLSTPQNRNMDPQEEVQLKFTYTNFKQSPHELTLKEFRSDLQVQLAKQLGRSVKSLDSVVSLIYNDQEVEIDPRDENATLSQVLQSNTLNERLEDVIVVMSPKLLNRKQVGSLDVNEPLHLMEVVDDGDKLKKTIGIGLHQFGKLYVRLLNGATVTKLYLITTERLNEVFDELQKQLNGDSTLEYAKIELGSQNSFDEYLSNYDVKVATSKTFSGIEWEISTSFILTKKYQKNALHILASIKPSSAEKPTMFMVPLKWDDIRVQRNGPAVELESLEAISQLTPVPTTVSEDSVPLTFKVRMSSQYAADSIGQTFEALQDESGNNGAATNSDNKGFVQATFEHPHTVTGIVIRPLLQSGWGTTYLAGSSLLYSHDEIEWKSVLQLNGLTDAATTFVVPSIAAPYWRIRKEGNGYLSIGTWKILGIPSTEPIPEVKGQPIEYYKTLAESQPTAAKKGEDLAIVPRPDCKKYEDHGDSSFNLIVAQDDQAALNNLVEPTQDSYATDGKFNNYFKVPLTILNKASGNLSTVKVEMAYKDATDQFIPMKNVKLGVKYQGWNGAQYQFFENHVANFETNQADNLVFSGAIEVAGSPGTDFNSRARAHKSLPQPLVIRVSVIDSDNKRKDILVEQANKPLDLYTVESFAKNNKVDTTKLKFVTCDNVESLERSYLAVYLDEPARQLVIKSSNGYSYNYVYEEFQKYMETAKKEAKKEIELNDGKTDARRVFMLFDAENNYTLYAFRLALTSETNATEKVVLVKDLLDQLAKM